jgi:hypothetical protein
MAVGYVEVAGTWELGWSAPKTEMDLWWSVMRTYEIPFLHMTPVTGLRHKMLMEHDSFEDMVAATDLTPVFVDENAECELADFEHPENALYLFGKATYSPFSNLSDGKQALHIKAPKPGMLWPHQCLAIVMNDRVRR